MDVTYASSNKRFFAYLIDQIGFIILGFVVVFLSALILSTDNTFILVLIQIVATFLVELLLLTVLKGKTIGKLLLKIKVVDAETFEQPSTKSLIKRIIIFRPIPIFLSLFLGKIGSAYILFSAIKMERTFNKQSIWDSFANTVVIEG